MYKMYQCPEKKLLAVCQSEMKVYIIRIAELVPLLLTCVMNCNCIISGRMIKILKCLLKQLTSIKKFYPGEDYAEANRLASHPVYLSLNFWFKYW